MLLQELIRRYEFDSIVPHLTTIDPENIPYNLYAFKEAFDDLRRMGPGDSGGEQIVVSTHVETDNDGTELDRYLHASNCEGDAWDACLAKEVIFGTAVGEEKALAQILWRITFWGFTPEHEGFRDDTPSNKFERKAKELERRQFLNYAKGIANSFEIEHLCLTVEGWAEYHHREAHRNRAKRMRDARQERSIARLERMGKVQRLIDSIMTSNPGYALCPENRQDGLLTLNPSAKQVVSERFNYLFDTAEISAPEFYSRTILKDGRAAYISKNITDYYRADSTEYIKAIVVIETSEEHPLRLSEFKPLQASIGRITGRCQHTCLLFGKKPDLGHDLHIQIVLSRQSQKN